MNRNEFILTTAAILFVAFAMGWFANWLLHRFTRVNQSDVAELDRMSQELHEAEETRDQAITYLQQREAELSNQLGQVQAEMSNQLRQTQAELDATMDGLHNARRDAEDLRSQLEQARAAVQDAGGDTQDQNTG